MFWLSNQNIIRSGFLYEIYKETNGVDLGNFYIVPFNNYFNKKPFSFDDFCREWIINQENPEEILPDFCSFMTDGNILIGYLDNLSDSNGNHFIGIAQGDLVVKDVLVISSSIFVLFDEIVRQLISTQRLHFPLDVDYWMGIDPQLRAFYNNGSIMKYKSKYLFDYDSVNYKNTIKNNG